MQEILDHLPDGARVLDLGCKGGSFAPSNYPHLVVISADIEKPGSGQIGRFVQADAAALPFPPGLFDAIILNHCLEHFGRLKPALQEIGRCINQRRGAIFVAVPDAKTVTDRLYRKLYYNSGGHVNLFGSDDDLSKMLSWYFGLSHVGTRVLCSSLLFLNRRVNPTIPVSKHITFRGVWEPLLVLISGIFRLLDGHLQTRLCVYGWALYFGTIHESVDPTVRPNVCVRCGTGHPTESLTHLGVVRKRWIFFSVYRCPTCGATNLFSRASLFESPMRAQTVPGAGS